MNLKIKRVYDAPASEDGTRILVDRLWPRGLTKKRAHVDLWLKQVAPQHRTPQMVCPRPRKMDRIQDTISRGIKIKTKRAEP
jgi:uncharacterized protein YeaO (DUF488 family)